MFTPEIIDLDRLHGVVESINAGQHTPRGAGRTFAYMYLMLGEVALGDANNTYLYVGPSYQIASWVMREFAHSVDAEFGPGLITRADSMHLRTYHNQLYIFVGRQDFAWKIKGLSIHRTFYDVQPPRHEDLREIYFHTTPNGVIL